MSGPARVHRGEKEGVFTAEALIEDRLRDPGGLRDLPRRHGMPVFAEEVARDPEDFVVGNRLGAAHAPQFRAMAARVPGRLVREPVGSTKRHSAVVSGQISEHSLIYPRLDTQCHRARGGSMVTSGLEHQGASSHATKPSQILAHCWFAASWPWPVA